MSFFDDAQAFMNKRQIDNNRDEVAREDLIRRLQAVYDNASRREIDRALDIISEKEDLPADFEILLKKIRIYLED